MILDIVQEGCFVNDSMLDNKVGQVKLKAARMQSAAHLIEKVGANLRAMMPWLQENKMVDKEKN